MVKSDKTKDNSATKVLAPGAIGSIESVPKERAQFRALLVGNPNYFGNLETGPFSPVLAIKGNTTYEEIKCTGFHPQANRLDAVVFVKQPYGYGGDVCSAGTTEYVRFYLSFDNGATWVDQGLTSFTAYDVPSSATGGRQLEYAVSLEASPPASGAQSRTSSWRARFSLGTTCLRQTRRTIPRSGATYMTRTSRSIRSGS